MKQISFQVADFDAPLDLILHLLSKHKLDIIDVDISSLLQQYLEVVETWTNQNLDVASEFLEMASRLVYMKTVSLLPKHEEESEQLRRDFAGELMEYRLCKVAAQLLDDQNQYGGVFVRSEAAIEYNHTYSHTHSASILYAALVDAMGRGARRLPPPRDRFQPLIGQPIVSVTTKIFTILRRLRQEPQLTLAALFSPELGKSGLVATFLAVLELMKSGSVFLEGDHLSLRTQNTRSEA